MSTLSEMKDTLNKEMAAFKRSVEEQTTREKKIKQMISKIDRMENTLSATKETPNKNTKMNKTRGQQGTRGQVCS